MLRDHSHRFDEWAPRYDRSAGRFFFHWVHRQVVARLRQHRLPSGVIVDVGAGTGELLVRVADILGRSDVVAVDASLPMIGVAAGKLPARRGIVASAAALPFSDRSAAAVVTTISFHHWDPQGDGLAEISRVLHPDGIVLLADFFAVGPLGNVVRRAAANHGDGFRSEQDLVRLLDGAGLRIRTAERLGPPTSPLRLITGSKPD